MNRAPNSPQIERGTIVLFGLMKPTGWPNVEALAMLLPKLLP